MDLNPNHNYLQNKTKVCKSHGSFKRILHLLMVSLVSGAELNTENVKDAQDPCFQRNSQPVAHFHWVPKRLLENAPMMYNTCQT